MLVFANPVIEAWHFRVFGPLVVLGVCIGAAIGYFGNPDERDSGATAGAFFGGVIAVALGFGVPTVT